MSTATIIAFDYCHRITKASGTTFYYASHLLPERQRQALWAVYAFARHVDDVVDEACEDGASVALELLDEWRRVLDQCFIGRAIHPIAIALAEVVQLCGLTREPFDALVDGCEMDLRQRRYDSISDLVVYCRQVASSVGRICVDIVGYLDRPAAHAFADNLGIALQLTNILRDVREDGERGRIYLPRQDLSAFQVSEAVLLGAEPHPASFADLMRYECERAEAYYHLAQTNLTPMNRRTLFPAEVITDLYYQVLQQIEADPSAPLVHRVRLTMPRKLGALARVGWQSGWRAIHEQLFMRTAQGAARSRTQLDIVKPDGAEQPGDQVVERIEL
jgi:15-cis-phytoene synthase